MIDVNQAGCSVEDCDGYTLRKMKLLATGENVVERATINEETGSVTYNKCGASGKPSGAHPRRREAPRAGFPGWGQAQLRL